MRAGRRSGNGLPLDAHRECRPTPAPDPAVLDFGDHRFGPHVDGAGQRLIAARAPVRIERRGINCPYAAEKAPFSESAGHGRARWSVCSVTTRRQLRNGSGSNRDLGVACELQQRCRSTVTLPQTGAAHYRHLGIGLRRRLEAFDERFCAGGGATDVVTDVDEGDV